MSILGAFNEAWEQDTEVGGGLGKPLPARRWYTGDIEVAEPQPHDSATEGRVFIQVGSILDADSGQGEFVDGGGASYRIGNRKIFERIWLGFTGNNADKVNQIAVQQLKELGWAGGVAGLERVKGEDGKEHIRFLNGPVTPLDVVAALPGKRVKFFVSKHETYNGKTNAKVGAWGRI